MFYTCPYSAAVHMFTLSPSSLADLRAMASGTAPDKPHSTETRNCGQYRRVWQNIAKVSQADVSHKIQRLPGHVITAFRTQEPDWDTILNFPIPRVLWQTARSHEDNPPLVEHLIGD
jgi:hypothetical protein